MSGHGILMSGHEGLQGVRVFMWCLGMSADMISIEDWYPNMVGNVWMWGTPMSTCSLSCPNMTTDMPRL